MNSEVIALVRRSLENVLDELADEIGKPMDRSLTPREIEEKIRTVRGRVAKAVTDAALGD